MVPTSNGLQKLAVRRVEALAIIHRLGRLLVLLRGLLKRLLPSEAKILDLVGSLACVQSDSKSATYLIKTSTPQDIRKINA